MPWRRTLHLLAVGAVEAHPVQRLVDGLLLLLAWSSRRSSGSAPPRRGALGEVDEVDGRLPAAIRSCDRLVQRHLGVLEVERHRALGGADRRPSAAPVSFVSALLEERRCRRAWPTSAGSARCGRASSGICQATPRSLVGVVVELVHHHVVARPGRVPRAAPCWRGSRRCSRRSARRG